MRKSRKFAALLTGAMALTSLVALSTFADSRHQDETWRSGASSVRRDDRPDRQRDELLSGSVARVDIRRGVVFLRERRSGRPIVVEMQRRTGRAGIGLDDLRRGDRVTFVGDWERGGIFEAWRIDRVDTRRDRR